MINIVYAASPETAVKSLKELNKNPGINIQGVITPPDKPKGRGYKPASTPVKTAAVELGIKVFQTAKISADTELIKTLKELKPDFLVTFAFGQILSQEVLDIPKFAVINLHASLLPEYRGANPIQRCIYDGKSKTGITSMITVFELDAGDICETQEIQIDENMTDIELRQIICDKAPALIYSTLKGLYSGEIKPKKQEDEGVSYAKKFTAEDALICWTKSAECIHNQVRSMCSAPNAYTFYKGKRIKIIETRKQGKTAPDKDCACVINVSKQGIEVNTGEGCLLITKVKPESRGVMSAYDFANGAHITKDAKLGE